LPQRRRAAWAASTSLHTCSKGEAGASRGGTPMLLQPQGAAIESC
jgi:hypothetical protein